MKKKVLALLCALAFLFSAVACDDATTREAEYYEKPPPSSGPGTWAVYWYLCGSDLETNHNFATEDLAEMLNVGLPGEVTVVVQTGGAQKWADNIVDAKRLERYVYNSEDLHLVESLPRASMGSADTLADFLDFCVTEYPAERQAVVFWNHGGGSVSGVAFDELYDYDSLTLVEIRDAFTRVCEPSAEAPPFELVGFDACLMATLDTAWALSDIARYMVASEDTEPGCGWDYEGFIGALAANPAMDGAALGTAICDSYQAACDDYYVGEEITLSVVDVTRIGTLATAYDNMGKEALAGVLDTPDYYTHFSREVGQAENYGGNTKQQGYTNMVDLGDLAHSAGELLPDTSQTVLNALDDCVVYQVTGPYCTAASGLAAYHSYSLSKDNLSAYAKVAVSEPFLYLYDFAANGVMSAEAMAFAAEMAYQDVPNHEAMPDLVVSETAAPPQMPLPELGELENWPLYLDEDTAAVLDVGPEIAILLSNVELVFYRVDYEERFLTGLGRDNDLFADWEKGVFYDNFRGVWGSIDGHHVYLELTYSGDDYNHYYVPILLNGEEYSLQVVYDFTLGEWRILGARRGLDDYGMSDKNLVLLQPGDEVTTLHYGSSLSDDDDDADYIAAEPFTVTEDTAFYEADLPDGDYMLMYAMYDGQNCSYYSAAAFMTIENGEILVEL